MMTLYSVMLPMTKKWIPNLVMLSTLLSHVSKQCLCVLSECCNLSDLMDNTASDDDSAEGLCDTVICSIEERLKQPLQSTGCQIMKAMVMMN